MNGFMILSCNLLRIFLYCRVSKLRAKFGSRRHFVNNEKIISLQKLVDLVECNVLYTETITLRKMMSDPLNVVQ